MVVVLHTIGNFQLLSCKLVKGNKWFFFWKFVVHQKVFLQRNSYLRGKYLSPLSLRYWILSWIYNKEVHNIKKEYLTPQFFEDNYKLIWIIGRSIDLFHHFLISLQEHSNWRRRIFKRTHMIQTKCAISYTT